MLTWKLAAALVLPASSIQVSEYDFVADLVSFAGTLLAFGPEPPVSLQSKLTSTS